MDKKGALGASMHKVMAAKLWWLDRESWDGDSEDKYGNDCNGNYNVSPSARSLVPSTQRVYHTCFTALSHASTPGQQAQAVGHDWSVFDR
eukprot:1809570-Rhodomonas_salina.3